MCVCVQLEKQDQRTGIKWTVMDELMVHVRLLTQKKHMCKNGKYSVVMNAVQPAL